MNRDSAAIGLSFQLFFEFGEEAEAAPLELTDPAFGDLVDRHRVEVMELLAATPHYRHEVRLLQQHEVLGYGLPGHVQVGAELAERLPVVSPQPVQQLSPACVGQRLEHPVHVGIHGSIMQPFGCMSTVILPGLRNSQRVVVKGTVDPFCVSLESVASEPCRTTIRNLQVILMTGRVLALTTLLACGCGDRAHKPAAIDVEAQRKAAEKAARAQRFEELLGSGKKALEAKRFDEAV